jgi:hypothetical protein
MLALCLCTPDSFGMKSAKWSPKLNCICWLRSIHSICSPSASNGIRHIGKLNILQLLPQIYPLCNLFCSAHTPEAPHPVLVVKIFCHRIPFSPSQLKQPWRYISRSFALQPCWLPEARSLPVFNGDQSTSSEQLFVSLITRDIKTNPGPIRLNPLKP